MLLKKDKFQNSRVGERICHNVQDVEKISTYLTGLRDVHQMAQKLLCVKIAELC